VHLTAGHDFDVHAKPIEFLHREFERKFDADAAFGRLGLALDRGGVDAGGLFSAADGFTALSRRSFTAALSSAWDRTARIMAAQTASIANLRTGKSPE